MGLGLPWIGGPPLVYVMGFTRGFFEKVCRSMKGDSETKKKKMKMMMMKKTKFACYRAVSSTPLIKKCASMS